jgi:hypothetical protein
VDLIDLYGSTLVALAKKNLKKKLKRNRQYFEKVALDVKVRFLVVLKRGK